MVSEHAQVDEIPNVLIEAYEQVHSYITAGVLEWQNGIEFQDAYQDCYTAGDAGIRLRSYSVHGETRSHVFPGGFLVCGVMCSIVQLLLTLRQLLFSPSMCHCFM